MVTTNQKPTKDTQKLERKEHKYTAKENHQTTGKKLNEEKNREDPQIQPENKLQHGNKYIPINNQFKYQWTK